MIKPLTIAEMRAQLPEAVRRSFSKPKEQNLTPEQIERLDKRTPLERALAQIPSAGNTSGE